jgi:DNA-binding protein H-NS
MRDLDALLNSLVNIDRNSLVTILASEAEAAQRLVNSARQRTERAKWHEVEERAARINGILSLFQHDEIASDMSEGDPAGLHIS